MYQTEWEPIRRMNGNAPLDIWAGLVTREMPILAETECLDDHHSKQSMKVGVEDHSRVRPDLPTMVLFFLVWYFFLPLIRQDLMQTSLPLHPTLNNILIQHCHLIIYRPCMLSHYDRDELKWHLTTGGERQNMYHQVPYLLPPLLTIWLTHRWRTEGDWWLLREKESVFLRNEPLKRLFNPKWSVLSTCKYKKC